MPSSAETPLRLTRLGKAWRASVVIILSWTFLAGSIVGNDHWWPFSPWRMFSTSQQPSGAVWSTGLEVRTVDAPNDWVFIGLTPWNVGINRAELEGQIPEIEADPDGRLESLARSHAQLNPQRPEWVGVRVIRRLIEIEDRKPTGDVDTVVVAEWAKS